MILIIVNNSSACEWIVFDYNKEILKTQTSPFRSKQLDIFNISVLSYSVNNLYKLKEKIKLILFYSEFIESSKYKPNLTFVFKDYFPNAKIQFDATLS